MIDDLYTRFRAYAMPNGGISMSYLVDSSLTLIEARYNTDNIAKIKSELELADRTDVDLLHISSWDMDCCNREELANLLNDLQPLEIEVPSYEPSDENGKGCRKIIREYCNSSNFSELFEAGSKTLYDPVSLPDVDFTDIIFSPLNNYQSISDNSLVKIFRQGKFSVLNVSKSNRAVEVLASLKQTGLTSAIDLLIAYVDGASENIPFFDEAFLGQVSPDLITFAGSKPRIMIKSNNSLDDRGIKVSYTETGDVLVKYGIMSRKEKMNLEKDNSIGNGEYKRLSTK